MKMKIFTLVLLSEYLLLVVPAAALGNQSDSLSTADNGARSLDLAGPWRFQLDPRDIGVEERWFGGALSKNVRLPGSLQEQGHGHDVSIETPWTGGIADRSWYDEEKYAKFREAGNVKVPFWLQPQKHYVGAAWYQRDVPIPQAWKGRRILLTLERPHWETTVWVELPG